MNRVGRAVWILLGALAWAGCSATRSGTGMLSTASVDEIHLLTMPMALNLDTVPGADGFAVKIYAVDKDRPKSIPISSGDLEILIYDGVLSRAALATNAPLSRWRFSTPELAVFAQKTSVGVVYAMTPTWKEERPRQEKMTVTACYVPPESARERRRVCSLPTTVTVSLPAGFK